jgi:hypothetical protein
MERDASSQSETLNLLLDLFKGLLFFGNLQSAKGVQVGIMNTGLLDEKNQSLSDLRKKFNKVERSMQKQLLQRGSVGKGKACIPYFGCFLDDLQQISGTHERQVSTRIYCHFFEISSLDDFVVDDFAHQAVGGSVNFKMCRMVADVIERIQQFQSIQYPGLQYSPSVQKWLSNLAQHNRTLRIYQEKDLQSHFELVSRSMLTSFRMSREKTNFSSQLNKVIILRTYLFLHITPYCLFGVACVLVVLVLTLLQILGIWAWSFV